MTWDTEGEWIRSPGKSMAGNQKCCSVGWDTQDSLTERFLRLLKPEAGEEGATPKYTWGQSRLCAWNWEQRQTWGPDRAGFYYEQSWVDFSKLQAKNGRHLTFRKGQASLWGANGGLAAKVEAGGTSSTASYPKDKGGSGLPSSSSAAAAKILRGGWIPPSALSIPPWGPSTWREQLYPARRQKQKKGTLWSSYTMGVVKSVRQKWAWSPSSLPDWWFCPGTYGK